MKMQGSITPKRSTVSTSEGYLKDQDPRTKRKAKERVLHFTFTGNDAPVKTIKAIMDKFGISKDDL